LVLLAMSFAVSAQDIYKQVDKDGKVTYTDKPPSKEEASQKVDINTERNVAKPLGSRPRQARELADSQLKHRADTEATLEKEIERARARLDLVKEELEKGKEPLDEEWMTGGVQGRTFRRPNEAYYERVKRLEESVRMAEEELANVRSGSSPKKTDDQEQSSPNPRRSSGS
jgi:hypothetical protein